MKSLGSIKAASGIRSSVNITAEPSQLASAGRRSPSRSEHAAHSGVLPRNWENIQKWSSWEITEVLQPKLSQNRGSFRGFANCWANTGDSTILDGIRYTPSAHRDS